MQAVQQLGIMEVARDWAPLILVKDTNTIFIPIHYRLSIQTWAEGFLGRTYDFLLQKIKQRTKERESHDYLKQSSHRQRNADGAYIFLEDAWYRTYYRFLVSWCPILQVYKTVAFHSQEHISYPLQNCLVEWSFEMRNVRCSLRCPR